MPAPRKITEKAPTTSGDIVAGIAASNCYARLRSLRGKVTFSRTAAELKADRSSNGKQ